MRHFRLLPVLSLVVSARALSQPFGKHNIVAYVTDWSLPSTIAYDKLDHVAYAFAIPDDSGKLSGFDASQLKKVVSDAHAKQKGVSLSVGGWTGSKTFSTLVASNDKRTKFVDSLVAAVKEYNLNGLNLDWEYPNSENGVSCNTRNPDDTANFLVLLQLLRTKLDSSFQDEHKMITAAVSTNVFNDKSGEPSTKLDKAWSTAMDYFYIMAYDITGAWSGTTGANSPLRDNDGVSVEQSVKSWVAAGIPAERLILGVPFYGTALKPAQAVTANTGIHVPLAPGPQIKGDNYDSQEQDPCPGSVPSYSGEYQWRSIVTENIQRNASGWTTYWDTASQTPFAYNAAQQKFLTFDNPTSLRAKTRYVIDNHLAGVMLWSLDMDDAQNSLLGALQGVRTV